MAPTIDNSFLFMMLGMAIVILVLIILIVMIAKVSKKLDGNMVSGKGGAGFSASNQTGLSAAVVEADDELIAVITAALAAFAPSGKRLVVRSVRRTSAWSDAGRHEQLTY